MNPFYHQKHFKRFLRIFLFSSFLFLLKSCFFYKKVSVYDFPAYEIPPNGVKISDKLFYDETEVSNVDWLVYQSWLEKHYGFLSSENMASFLYTDIWENFNPAYSNYDTVYLKHIAYRGFPVVGVTHKQAKAFSEWRSNIVFERILNEHEILPEDTGQFADKIFTIEKYFRGEYNSIQPDTNIKYYLEFRLPTIEERKIALHYSDSVLRKYTKHCISKKCKLIQKELNKYSKYISRIKNPELRGDPVNCCYDFNIPIRINDLDHIRGNISEWLAEENVCAGGSWIDSRERILKSDTFHVNGPKVWVGFRNVAEWKSVDSLLIELGIERK